MANFKLGQNVRVTMGDWVFDSEVVDIVDNCRNQGVWVDHPQLKGEDMLFIDLSKNTVEPIDNEPTIDVEKNDIKAIRKELEKAIKWEDEDINVSVKIYDCFEDDTQSYDIEIQYAIGDEVYTDCYVSDSFYSNIERCEVALKMAKKRANAVLKIVKGWFKYDDNVTVTNGVEVYRS